MQGITETLIPGAQGAPFEFIPHKPRASSTALPWGSALAQATAVPDGSSGPVSQPLGCSLHQQHQGNESLSQNTNPEGKQPLSHTQGAWHLRKGTGTSSFTGCRSRPLIFYRFLILSICVIYQCLTGPLPAIH